MKKLDAKGIAAQAANKAAGGYGRQGDKGGVRAIIAVPVRKIQSAALAPDIQRLSSAETLTEATALARAIGLDIRFSGTVPLSQIRPATLFGSGKVEEIGALAAAEQVSVVIVDHPLTPVQQRNLEKAWNVKVLDRTGLILEIFAERAQSKEGKLQVELARLTYQKSRLVRSWTHLERQKGGFGFLGGPGETQIEADRRAIGERIDSIKSELGVVERTRRLHRRRRKVNAQRIVALAGYTNAGKSTLFNALSGAGVLAEDMLFATLDPALRRVALPGGGDFILSDTVGFISDLPTQLVAAFRSTLEEILEADLILHVRDISSGSSEAQRSEVYKVLAEIGITEPASQVIEVWNKADLVSDEERRRLRKRAEEAAPPAVLVSASAGQGLDELARMIQLHLKKEICTRAVTVEHGDGRLIHWLYENTEIVERRDDHDGSLHFQVRLPSDRVRELDRHLGLVNS